MKNLFTYLFLFSTFIFFGQINLEHTYFESNVQRINLEYSGEKYYEFKNSTNELLLYNSDHSLWKTIVLPVSGSNQFTPTRIFNVSETLVNSDNNVEVIFSYYNNTTTGYETKIISENQTIITTITDSFWVYIDKIEGLSSKLITLSNSSSNPLSKVYSFPNIILESTSNLGQIRRIKLENSGEKYYVLDKINQIAILYNTDFTIWKTINLPKPLEANYVDIFVVYQDETNELIKIGYTYAIPQADYGIYTGKVVDENSVELLSIPNVKSMHISKINGFDNKLFVLINEILNGQPTLFYSKVYKIPELVLENTYESIVKRVILENSGEKYYTSQNPEGSIVKIYNANHSLWKSIPLDLPNQDVRNTTINFISETKINPDEFVELSCSYDSFSVFGFAYSHSQIINENGLSFLEVNNSPLIYLSEISNLNPKLIGAIANYDLNNDATYYGTVYNHDALSNSYFENASQIKITPNPANSFLIINSLKPLQEAKFFNSVGMLVKKESLENKSSINVEELPDGVYLLLLKDYNNSISTHKIIISN